LSWSRGRISNGTQGRDTLPEARIVSTARFARTGNLNTPGLPAWSEWPAKKYPRIPKYILFDADDTTAHIAMAVDAEQLMVQCGD
jgi:hypothetical protein